MLQSTQYISSTLIDIGDRIILDPLQLLYCQLQTKDIPSRKHTLQSIDTIALTMQQKEITSSLVPFLVKTLIEENNKELKVLIVKTFGSLLPLLSKQGSFIRLLEVLLDLIIVLEEQDIRVEALSVVEDILFGNQQQEHDIGDGLLQFTKVKDTFKNLAMIELRAVTQPTASAKNATQLSFYLIKYLLKHSDQLGLKETQVIIDFLKNTNLISTQSKDFMNLKNLSEHLYLLVEVWPKEFVGQLDFFVDFLVGNSENEKNSQNEKKISQQDAQPQKPKQLNQPLPSSLIILQVPPQIMSQIKSTIIPAIISYANRFDLTKAYNIIITNFLNQQDPKIKISLIKKTKQIFETFKNNDLSSFLTIFRTFSQQPQDIKKAILEVIDFVELENEEEKFECIVKPTKNALELRNILIQALIRSNKSQSVSQVLTDSDYDLKVKIFVKLPDCLLHGNKAYADIIDSLLSEPKKNFRSKLNIILNLISRIEEVTSNSQKREQVQSDNLSQTFDISYLLLPLTKYFGDRIATIRIHAAKLYALILYHYPIDFSTFSSLLQQSFYTQTKGWFERQNVLIMIKEYLQIHQNTNGRFMNQTESRESLKKRNMELYNFVLKVLKFATKVDQKDGKQKLMVKNIALLAEQIIQRFSIEAK